jgi:Cys-rich protein (TIGR01571 family)
MAFVANAVNAVQGALFGGPTGPDPTIVPLGRPAPSNFQPENGLCGCFSDTGNCASTLCCWWCTQSNVYNKMFKNAAGLDPMACIVLCVGDYFCNNQASNMCIVATRRQVIEKFNIQGESFGTTLCCAAFCGCCQSCQTQRELKARGYNAGGICDNSEGADEPPTMPFGPDALLTFTGGRTGGMMPANMPPDWASGICCANGCMPDCCDCFWCYPCAFAKILTKLDAPAAFGPGQTPCACLDCCCCMVFPCAAAYASAMQVSQRYYIPTDPIKMGLLSMLCTACVFCQVRAEMNQRGEYPGGCCCEAPANAVPQLPNPALMQPIQQPYPEAQAQPVGGAVPSGKGV